MRRWRSSLFCITMMGFWDDLGLMYCYVGRGQKVSWTGEGIRAGISLPSNFVFVGKASRRRSTICEGKGFWVCFGSVVLLLLLSTIFTPFDFCTSLPRALLLEQRPFVPIQLTCAESFPRSLCTECHRTCANRYSGGARGMVQEIRRRFFRLNPAGALKTL